MDLEISDFICNEYKDFANYTLYSRAIPSLCDGFKPVQRKAMYCMQNKSGKIKVMSLAGRLISDGNYMHGDGPASQAISSMAQDFIGSNNTPFFHKKGNFGNRFIKTPSAPRYIYVKNNPIFKKIFLDKMLEKYDLENPEPKFFIPTIPTILLNGVEGMAVGFATKILPYDIDDIIKYIFAYLNNKKLPTLNPYFKGYTGSILLEEDKWIMRGKYEIINTTKIKITEIPIQMDREKYLIHLSKLIEKGHINSFIDKSSKNWDITIRLKRKSPVFNNPEKYLKLTQVLSENITTIDENGKLKIFNNVYELIDYFINFRMNIYTDRKKWMINYLENDIKLIQQRIKFIKHMCKINFKKMSAVEIINSTLKNLDISEKNLKKCMTIKAFNLNKDYMEKLKQKIIDNQKQMKYYKKTSEQKLYETDLEELK